MLLLWGLGPVGFRVPTKTFYTQALIDSGSAVNLIDHHFVEELSLSTILCVTPLRVTVIDNRSIGKGYLTQQTLPLTLQIHEPQISWKEGRVNALATPLPEIMFLEHHPTSLPRHISRKLRSPEASHVNTKISARGYNTILEAINRFLKACRLVPLKGLPTAMETAKALFNQVFQNYGLPEDIVLDLGPQFTSQVWGAFCAQLGINVSLSSVYHPQTN
ncbi:hypothetical protein QTP86_025842 [Hemibagrus guttatus]|nr:hypothetical protein QTP86_025842 [Hemibagrus guttatus]